MIDDTIHSCGPFCERPACVAARRIQDWVIDDSKQHDPAFPYPYVKVTVRIRDNASGVIRVCDESLGFNVEGFEGKPFDYCWIDGNFACDCNRSLFFLRVAGESDEGEAPCGDTAFSIQLINPKDGRVFYDEFED